MASATFAQLGRMMSLARVSRRSKMFMSRIVLCGAGLSTESIVRDHHVYGASLSPTNGFSYLLLSAANPEEQNESWPFLTVLLKNVVFELAGVVVKTDSAKGTQIGVWLLSSYVALRRASPNLQFPSTAKGTCISF